MDGQKKSVQVQCTILMHTWKPIKAKCSNKVLGVSFVFMFQEATVCIHILCSEAVGIHADAFHISTPENLLL